MYWNRSYECMDQEQLRELQLERLKILVRRVYSNVPFYRNKFQELGLLPTDINRLEDLNKLPFTVKSDLRDHYPYGLFAEPMNRVVRIHASSGTTGKPTVVGYTAHDIAIWSEMAARCLVAAGANRDSVIQNAYGYGLFTGGLGIHNGAEHLGAAIIPISGGNTEKQLLLLQDFGTTILTCTPSYAIHLADTIRKQNIPLESLHLKVGVLGAEPWSERMREEIENKLHIKAYDIYGLSEIYGPGVGIECDCQNGLHVWEDNFIIEIIDPDTLEVLPDGQKGELVITTITKEAMPLIRYRTRDITSIISEPCPCGRTHRRIKRISGRSDDMLIIRGVNVFPSQIEAAIMEIPQVSPYYQIIVRRDGNLDTIEIQLELNEDVDIDQIYAIEKLKQSIKVKVHSITGVNAKITLVEPMAIERTAGKSKRVIDLRKI